MGGGEEEVWERGQVGGRRERCEEGIISSELHCHCQHTNHSMHVISSSKESIEIGIQGYILST